MTRALAQRGTQTHAAGYPWHRTNTREIITDLEDNHNHWDHVAKIEQYAARGELSPYDPEAGITDLIQQGTCVQKAMVTKEDAQLQITWDIHIDKDNARPSTTRLGTPLTEGQHITLTQVDGRAIWGHSATYQGADTLAAATWYDHRAAHS